MNTTTSLNSTPVHTENSPVTKNSVTDPAGEGDPTWPVWTGDQFPFRVLLLDELELETVRNQIAEAFELASKKLPTVSFGELAEIVLQSLCGQEPLTQPSLLLFLDSFAGAVESAIRRRIGQGTDEKPATQSIQAHGVDTSKSPAVPEGNTPLRLSPAQVQGNPIRTTRILDELSRLEMRDREMARRLRLIEFAGSTEAELALYFGVEPTRIQVEVDLAAADVLSRAN